jgi:hypothetical protein
VLIGRHGEGMLYFGGAGVLWGVWLGFGECKHAQKT